MNFSNYRLEEIADRGLRGFADGVLGEMAEVYGVPFNDRPSPEQLNGLVQAVGGASLQERLTAEDAHAVAAGWLERSGLMQPMQRSLWLPEPWKTHAETYIVAPCGSTDEQHKTVETLENRLDYKFEHVWLVTPASTLETEEEKAEVGPEKEDPTEADYAQQVMVPRLIGNGYRSKPVNVRGYDVSSGEAGGILDQFMADDIAVKFQVHRLLLMVRAAGEGLMQLAHCRNAIQRVYRGFDKDPRNPRAFVASEGMPIATNPVEAQDSNYADPLQYVVKIPTTAQVIWRAAPVL